MPTPTPKISRPAHAAPRPLRTPRRTAALAAALALAALAGACAAPLERRPEPLARDSGGEPLEGAGGSWAAVLHTPGVARITQYADLTTLPEYARNDAALGNSPRGPLLATAQWPEPARPDLAYPRRVFLDPRPDAITFFQAGPTSYAPYRTYPGAPNYVVPGDGGGAWGFWR
jgi:hypothetical protein